MKNKLPVLLFLLLVCGSGYAQLATKGKPISILESRKAAEDAVVHLTVPQQEISRVDSLRQDTSRLKALRFAYTIPVHLSLHNSGEWFELDQVKVWRLRLQSPGAYSLNVIFDRYKVPEGARLFIYSEDEHDLIGAFTSANNKERGQLATAPVASDRIVIQYEEPLDAEFDGELSLAQVNHDFLGIKAYSGGRRPLGESGSCNENVNCDYLDDYREVADAVCRILINGNELCTGTLLNNVREDGSPYIYTANHCIESSMRAQNSVFLFNYESPYCESIDGEILNTISSSSLLATSPELDFSLVELSVEPPASYQPYYLGWDRSAVVPASSLTVHHPQGDIKKLASDEDAPSESSFQEGYLANGFWRIGDWESGTTESGSSGAALVDGSLRVRGSLVGGAATCADPVDDFFSQFRLAWDYYGESGKQLKAWLDPDNRSGMQLNGFNPYQETEVCSMLTNLVDTDSHFDGMIDQEENGYYSGSNAYGFTAFAEAFNFGEANLVQGVNLGVSVLQSVGNSHLQIQVYEGAGLPETMLYSESFELNNVQADVMNYFEFSEPVRTHGRFFLVWSIEDLDADTSFAVFLASRTGNSSNSYYIQDGGEWYSYSDKALTTDGSAAVLSVLHCYEGEAGGDNDSIDFAGNDVVAYPNPVASGQRLSLRFAEDVFPENIEVFDLLGRKFPASYTIEGLDRVSLSFDFVSPGIYFIRIHDQNSGRRYKKKIVVLGTE